MASAAPELQVDDTSSQRTRPEGLRASRGDVDYRKLHRGPPVTQRNETQIPGTREAGETGTVTKPVAARSKDQPSSAASLATILQTVIGIKEGLRAAEERALKAEERALKAEETERKTQEVLNSMTHRIDEMAAQLGEFYNDVTEQNMQQGDSLTVQIGGLKEELMANVQDQIANIQMSSSPSPSYAEIARTAPNSQPSNLRTLTSMNTTPSTMTDTLYCTVDTSRVDEDERSKAEPGAIREAIEKEMRTAADRGSWRCTAVIRDPRNTARIRVTCRDESELQLVKEAAQKTAAPGARVLRDQLYPVKVDNANRTAILDQNGVILPEVMEALGKENEVHIAKMAWLSKKDTSKAYGTMVVYVTKGSDAVRLLQGQYFHVAGESAYTRVYEARKGPTQCYKCQGLGHKAFSCMKPQTCARCAQEGHHHRDCQAETMKCIPCGGPHESFSRNCRVLYPIRHE